MSIIMPINIVKVYYNLALALYAKGLLFKAVVEILVMSTTVSKQLKALLASSTLIEVALLGIRFLKVIKQVVKGCFSSSKLSLDLISIIMVLKILLKSSELLLLSPLQSIIYYLKYSLKRLLNYPLVWLLKRLLYSSLALLYSSSIYLYRPLKTDSVPVYSDSYKPRSLKFRLRAYAEILYSV